MLKVSNIHTYYGAIEALKGVSIEVNQGEIVTLIGANGAGKSTLLNTICGSPKPKSGSISFLGQDITTTETHDIMRMGLSLVPEGRRVFSGLTVEENLKMGGFFSDDKQIDKDLKHIYELFPRLLERSEQRAGTLSGGEQQMLAIGRGLMMHPKLLLLDEPSLGLAPIIINQIFQIIQDIRDSGITVFLIEQNANKALQIADRGYVLETGEVVMSDTGTNLHGSEAVKKAYLGG